jgi:hypothetical protein
VEVNLEERREKARRRGRREKPILRVLFREDGRDFWARGKRREDV